MHLKNNFFIKSSIFGLVPWESPEGPLEVPDVRTFRGPSGDVPETSCAGWVKTLVKHISGDCKCNNDKCQCQSKTYRTCKKDFNWNPTTCICKCRRYLKSIVRDKVINVRDNVSTNATNTILANVTRFS